MATDIRLKEGLPEITEALVATYTECQHINHLGHKPLPSREAIVDIICDLMDILYPGFVRRQNLHIGNVEYHVGDLVDGLHDKLTQQIARVLRHDNQDGIDFESLAQQKTIEFLKRLPDLRYVLEEDVLAAFVGDPAAKSYPEIIFCYPGLEAITI
ncbi:MAG TPA: serine acetyltransferase, partial [Gemmataceae bacterium]|nr:serine acetyltransferase [Gemmataceae bacterium]